MRRRIRWVLAGLGRKPAADASLAMLLRAEDLPGPGWKQQAQRTWRTGEADPGSGPAQRARAMGSITAWRSFRRPGTSRSVWVQLTPWASWEDAAAGFEDLAARLLANLRAEVEVVTAGEADPPEVPGADRVWAYRQTTRGDHGEGCALYLAVQADTVLTVVCGSGETGGWDWAGLGPVAAAQVARISEKSERGAQDG